MQTVYLHRKLRDGSETIESMPEWAALATIATLPYEEPNTASAWVRRDMPQAVKRLSQNAADLALAMAGQWDARKQAIIH